MILALLAAALTLWQTSNSPDPEAELQTGITLSRGNHFQEAIPHFLAARGRVAERLAVEFNLALCYVGTEQYPRAIEILVSLENSHPGSQVENLLAQAYIGNRQPDEGLAALKKAAAIDPKNEKLYVFVSDACLKQHYDDMGVEIVNIGLRNLPNSPRLLFQRALFESRLEEIDSANRDFELAHRLSPDSDLGYIAAVQENLLSGNISAAIHLAREGISKGHEHYMLLTALGEALIRSGATSGQPEWREAKSALEKAVAEKPDYSSAQIAIGKMFLIENRIPDALTHLESGRQLDPYNLAVYPSLAAAYRRAGRPDEARAALAMLEHLNKDQALRISSSSGGHAGIAGPPR